MTVAMISGQCSLLLVKFYIVSGHHDYLIMILPVTNHIAGYFMTKIENIRSALPDIPLDVSSSSDLHCTTVWNELTAVSEADVMEIITKSLSPSCLLDPLPSWIVKKHLDVLLLVITSVVNRSLAEGVVPEPLKTAIIVPLHNIWLTSNALQLALLLGSGNMILSLTISQSCIGYQLSRALT